MHDGLPMTRRSGALTLCSNNSRRSTRPRCDRRQPADHVSAVCRYGYLRRLRPVTQVLAAEAARTVVHAFISSHLDYCNSLLFGISDNLLRRLQAVQNAAARRVTGTGRREHIRHAS